MTAIIPRWEFRTFGNDFGAAEASFAVLTPGEPHDSDELYLLSRDEASAANVVKVRDDLMDVKALREVSADGLERWEPVFKVGFPIAAADVGRVLEALHLPPRPSRGRPTPSTSSSTSSSDRVTGSARSVSTSGGSASRSADAWPTFPT